ncbi:thiamine pyrophosphate enzyme [Cordyceps fumosorosea ARSEF 2679]|uniref:Thiamine pyrophosphate enzyme n=1 Tax=Cordyceps fumosorosea (strain ARSEF 2679) TaxID=1081104 RepID=A0A167LZ40_CORFA|nr:thiamine pyrophosphate enzyme [Cordyceps fumosorosea ARSEF 2679]OAA53712.1 thiamine pyrophosphate enzyme [Cordyceps fumosorosea ARSEF 2679]
MYTASNAFFDAIWDAGVTHCFVNLGSDHPSFLNAMVQGQREKKDNFPRIITCPNEMVAMSMADGFARLTNRPQCVIVHVDVGTQALAAAVHNASAGRCPVLVFAGLSPFTLDGEHRGSRTEHIHWMQDVPDQRAILAQYCRYAGELKTPRNVKQLVNRALQFARSDPQGPAYLCGAREIMEAEVEPYEIKQEEWSPIALGGLPRGAAGEVAWWAGPRVSGGAGEVGGCGAGVAGAGHGRVRHVLPGDARGVGGLAVRRGAVHRGGGRDPGGRLRRAVDPDAVPAARRRGRLPRRRRPAEAADARGALEQILASLGEGPAAETLKARTDAEEQQERVRKEYEERLARIEEAAKPKPDGGFGAGHLCSRLRELCPPDTIWAVEAVTNTPWVHDNIRASLPGSLLNCGGGGLGWSGGAALGIKLATDADGDRKFVVQIVGDGTYMFSVPSSVYWISKRYNIPILTIVLNNNGWNAPRQSYNLVHPDGIAQTATNDEINIAFNPTPDYAGIAKAAACGDLFAARVSEAEALPGVLREAIENVKAGRSAVLDCAVVLGC